MDVGGAAGSRFERVHARRVTALCWSDDKRTALHLAASEGNRRLCEFLLDSGASVNCRDRWNGTPLSDAMREGHLVVAHLLMARGGELGWDEMRTSSELCDLARKGDISGLDLLLRAGCQVNAADYDSRTCLHLAASEGHASVVDRLLAAPGLQVDATDRWGGTPLRDAVRISNRVVATRLVKAGASLGLDEVQTSSELCELAKEGLLERLELFLQCGAEPNAKDYDSRTALHLAVRSERQSLERGGPSRTLARRCGLRTQPC